MGPEPNPVERFWRHVVVRDGCWGWTRYRDKDGYGKLWVNRTFVSAHRFSWELHHGPIPDGLCVIHTCDNPPCSNPEHLRLGTVRENTWDAARKRRLSHGKDRPAAKLTDAAVLDIRARYRAGETQQAIADRYSVTRPCIGYVVRRETWTHI